MAEIPHLARPVATAAQREAAIMADGHRCDAVGVGTALSNDVNA